MNYFILSLLVGILSAFSANAQRFDSYQTNQRLGQIEQSIAALQQQMMQEASTPHNVATGRMGAELARTEEHIRALNGKIEKLQYQLDQTNKRLNRFQEDVEFRLQPQPPYVAPSAQVISPDPLVGAVNMPDAVVSPPVTSLPQQLPEVAKLTHPSGKRSEAPREVYNRSFSLLNQTDYSGAEKGFNQFIHQFPTDPLIGNAWYWLGETHYVRRDYVKAADSFRQGFEVVPDGPKSGDNLLKLAMSLAALQRDGEACIVLRQVDKKYAANSADLRDKTKQELNRMGCPK